MANWENFSDNVKAVGNGKLNFVDPNNLLYSSTETIQLNKSNANGDVLFEDKEKKITHTWSPEDFCIDVDLTLEVPSRSDYATTSNQLYLLKWNGDGKDISIQSGHRFYYGKNYHNDNVEDGQSETDSHINYLSTRDIDVTYYDLIEDNVSTEMLGLNSVEISYETMFCPIVKMQFTDVHGISLFAPMERNHTTMVDGVAGYSRNDIANSFYRALFNLPYPKATLRVKGLYGAPTIYELTFKNISTSFDNSIGGFKINVELMGYTYSFLAEVPVLHSMISPTSEYYGKSYWDNHKVLDNYKMDNGAEPLTWFEMVKKITDAKGKIQLEEQDSSDNDTAIKRQSNNQQLIDNLNNLKSQQGNTLNLCADYITSAFKEGSTTIVRGKNYIAIGYDSESTIWHSDILSRNRLLKDANEDKFNAFITAFNAEKELNKNVRSNKSFAKGYALGSLLSTQRTINGEWNLFEGRSINTDSFVDFENNVSNGLNGDLDDISIKFPNSKSVLLIYYGFYKDNRNINNFETIESFIRNYEDNKKELENKADEQRTQIVQECLGFRPTLRNIMKTLMFHCETYLNMIDECANEAHLLQGQRKATDLGFEMSVADFKTDFVPPFPEYCEMQDGKWVQGWIGNIKQEGIEPERKFVDSMFNAIEIGEQEISVLAPIMDNQDSVDTSSYSLVGDYSRCLMNYAIIPSDIMNGGYAFLPMSGGDFESFVNNGNASAILSILYLRAMNLFGKVVKGNSTNNQLSRDLNYASNINQIAEMDAWNFYWQFKNLITSDFANKLEQVLSNSNITEEISNVLNGNGHIDLDGNKESLSVYYAKENGCKTNALNTPNTYTLYCDGRGSLKHTNTYDFSSMSVDAYADSSILYTSTANGKFPSKISDIKGSTYRSYRNYIVFDESSSMFSTNALSRVKGKYDSTSNPLHSLMSVNKDKELSKKTTIPYDCNLFDRASDGVAEFDEDLSSKNLFSESMMDITSTSDGAFYRKENVFCSVFYYGIRNEDKVLQDIQRSIYALVSKHHKVAKNGKHLDHYLTYKPFEVGNYGFVSKLQLLQYGAVCFSHFFLQDKMYECFTDVNNLWCSQFTFKKAVWDSRYATMGEKQDFESSRWFVVGVEDNVRNYALALYFYDWYLHEWKTLKESLEFTQITDAKSFNEVMQKLHTDPTTVKNIPSGYEDGKWIDDSYGLRKSVNLRIKGIISNMLEKKVFVLATDYKSVDMDFKKVCGSYLLPLLSKIKDIVKSYEQAEMEKQNRLANNSTIVSSIKENNTPIDPKISIYQATKRLWDKWLSGLKSNPITMDFFNEHFHFIDTFYNEIGDDILIDVTYLAETFVRVSDQHQNWDLLSYIQEILRKSNILFHNIQNWADLGNKNTMAKAFVPMSYIESHNMYPNDSYTSSISNTDFVCIYSYEPSHRLNYGSNTDESVSDTTDDSFVINYESSITDLPIKMGEGMGSEFMIPAFAVTYAKQYQSYFTNIQVDSNAGMQTEWSIGATLNIAKMGSDKAGEALTYKGQDLYTVYSNQSFTCKVDMVGCCWVQPLMYFVLTNIPMYRGTYMIYKVTHSISGGQMKTHFEGYRISRIGNRLVDGDSTSNNNTSANSIEPSYSTKKADLNNDCGYSFHNPIQQEQTAFNVDFESTWNIDALKSYKPSYIIARGWTDMWDAICGTLYREYSKVNIEGQITTLSMLNLHAVGVKRYAKAFAKTRNSGKEKVGGIFRGGWEQIMRQAFKGSYKKCTDQKFIAMVEEVFKNPIKAILGDADEIPSQLPNMEFSYRKKPFPYPADKSKGTFYLPNVTAYKYNAPNGTLKSATQTLNKKTLRTIGRYSAPWEYAGHICGHHWDAMYYLSVAPISQYCQLYSDTDMKGEIWNDEDFANFTKAPNATPTEQTNTTDENLAEKFVGCLQQSANETDSFGNTEVRLVKKFGVSLPIAKYIGINVSGDFILISCSNREKNALLFDMLCLGDGKGYLGWWDSLSWITDSKSNENPQYLLLSLRKNVGMDFVPKIYLHSLQQGEYSEGESLNVKNIESMFSSNFGNDLKGYPSNFWKIMSKSVPTDAVIDRNQMLQSFSYAFGGTKFVIDNFGSVANDGTIAYYLDKNKALSCVQSLESTDNGNTERIKDIVSAPTNETFAEMFPNSTTLRCSKTDKLKTFIGPVQYNQNITSGFGPRKDPVYKGRKTPEPHKGVDFTSETVRYGGNAVAGYDGKVVGIFLGDGYGYVVVIAYNIQNENGDLLVCGYPHFKQENIRVKVGQQVKGGDVIAPLGKEGKASGIHSHFFMAWYKADNGKFKWDGRYGPHNELLRPINPMSYIDFQNVVHTHL